MAIEFVDVLDAANNTYDNTISGLPVTRVKDALDVLESNKVTTAQEDIAGTVTGTLLTNAIQMTEAEYNASAKTPGHIYFIVG